MKLCSKCCINVGGEFQYCPLCQSELSGESSELYFPHAEELKKKSMIYRIQLFVSISAVIITLFLDYMIGLHGKIHWSNISVFSIVVIQIVLKRLIRRQNINLHYYIFHLSITAAFILMIISYYLNFWNFSWSYIIPSLVMMVIGSLFFLCLKDRTGNVMAYLLAAVSGGIIIPALVLLFFRPDFLLLWKICLMVSAVVIAAIGVFKGSRALNEIHKRLHM